MAYHVTRRSVVSAALFTAFAPRLQPGKAQTPFAAYGYPMGTPGRPPGDGVYVRIAYAAENAAYYPGWWHTGENWHAVGEQSAGMAVYAVAAGEVVYADYDYPGRVVIIRHDDGFYAQYGHLDYTLAVAPGDLVARGQPIATVLAWSGDLARSHLHFELRTFYTQPEINGDAPQYGVNCGFNCPPGPGYWPMAAPRHPSDLGWRNPSHVIARRVWPHGLPEDATVVVAATAPASATLWTAPGNGDQTTLPLTPGTRYPLLGRDAGEEASTTTSATATQVWYQIRLPQGETGWVQALLPSEMAVGGDGRPAALIPAFVPDIGALPA